MELFGKDLITTQDWSIEEIEALLKVAKELKKSRFKNRWSNCLEKKTFLMLFYNPSMRTRESFECAATELGGHAQYLETKSMRLKRKEAIGEEPKDVARVMSNYGCGIGIRILEDSINKYGEGDKLIREYAKHAEVPVISMAHDKYHPCQALADLMALRTRLGNLKNKKLFLMWSSGHLVRSWSSVQAALLLLSRVGMDVTLTYPKGWDLDGEVIEKVKNNVASAGSGFEITHSLVSAEGADVVYSRNWMSPLRYQSSKEEEIELALKHKDWICDEQLIDRTNNAYFMHPMPVERGWEVTDEVVDSERSLIYEIAENRLHVQKALLALTMGER
jgi:N-acetylornithine carbamoyltransferase